MVNEKEVVNLINSIVARQLKALEEVANEKNIQIGDPEDFLLQEIKKQFGISIKNLHSLYNDFIDTDECTLGVALQYIPLFTVYGLINAAQLGVTQEEYYKVVEYYITEKFDLVDKGDKKGKLIQKRY